MSDIQFIFEKPQKPARTVKKRTRLITSCDACRVKKIKCRPTGHGDDKCESCEASGSACVFDERNRIRSQRGIANFTVAPTRHTRKVALRSSSPSRPSLSVIPTPNSGESSTPSSSTSASSTARRKSSPKHHTSYAEHASNGVNAEPPACHGEAQSHPEATMDDYTLFDPYRQAYPHPTLLPHLVDLFLLYAGSLFPFFEPDETARSAREGTLSPLLANCLAAYAARFSDDIRHPPDSRYLSGEPYLDAAKCFLSSSTLSKLERLHAIILVAWIENGSGRTNSFYTYSQMASGLAAELRLGSEESICEDPSEERRSRCRLTFWSVVWLDIVACSVTGKSCTLRLDECSTGMPYPEVKSCGTLSRSILYQAFKGILNLMISLNKYSNSGKPSAPSPHRDVGLRQIQLAITNFKDRLPPSLAFTTQNLSLSTLFRESFAFYLVHVLMHCFLVISHCPSLFWMSQPPKTITEMPRLDIAWASATAIVDILILMRNENMTFATGLSSTFLPLSIARGALLLAQTDVKSAIIGTSMSIDEFELTTRFYLEETAEMLKNLSSYWSSMHHVEIATEAVALSGIHTVPQDLRALPIVFRSLSLNDAWSQPSSGDNNPFDYLDGPTESDECISQTKESWRALSALGKEVVTVDRYALACRNGQWQDVHQLSSNT